jgi:sortase A
MTGRWCRTAGALVVLLLLSGCAAAGDGSGGPAPTDMTTREDPAQWSAPGPQERAAGETVDRRPGPRPSDGRPAAARLTIPALDLVDLRVVPYRGRTDDARGTAIQNAGSLASPHGPGGGTGPGGVGNYQVTGHRLSSTAPFRYLPRLRDGARILVDVGERRFVYRVVATRETSFRSARSLREQRAAVPGRPGATPTRAMITLSTCATLEDHAAGNYWSDEFDNPEHRIDKIGVLARVVRR